MYDIIVAGAGPAGAIAGKYLAQAGKKVLLVQKDFSFKKPCGGGIRYDAFEEFDINEKLVRSLVTTVEIETEKKCITFDISNRPLGIVDRVEFDQSLRNDASDAGATVIEGKVIDVKVSSENVQIEVKTKDTYQTYTAEYIVAADGVLSMVREKCRKEEVPKGLVHYSDVSSLSTDKCHFYFGSYFTRKAYAWRFPYEGGSDVGTVGLNNSQKYIHNLFKFLGIKSKEKIKGYHIPIWDKPIFYDNRVFYVGDAAGQVMPFTYEGIYYGMKSAKILAEVLIEDVDFQCYEERWNKLYLQKFSALKKLERIFLANDFMISILMKTLENESLKSKILDLWMDKYTVKVNGYFFIRMFKRYLNFK